MRSMRVNVWIGALFIAFGGAASLVAQSGPTTSPAKAYAPPKTPWGDPDLQGIWPGTAMVGVPFERLPQFGNRLYLTEAEFQQRQKDAEHQSTLDNESFTVDDIKQDVVAMGDVGGPTSPPPYWLERGEPSRQSSLIVDPPDGRLPSMTPDGLRRVAATKNTYLQYTGFNSANELGPYDRCISRGVLGSMFPVVYNNGNQFVQAPGVVALRNEMIHETRTIPLDNRPAPSATLKSYMGYSRGHFEGNTLVVKTTNFNGATGATANGNLMLMSDALEVTEKFTRTGPDTMQYEVTVNDPKTWTRPWTASFPLRRDPTYKIFEYACHEGNHAMSNILSGSRADEKAH